MEPIVVYITAPNESEAEKIAKALVEEGLAGCVNIINNIRSIYSWQGKMEDEAEVLMIVKTGEEAFDALEKKVKELHSYSVPEIIGLPIVKGSLEYCNWLSHAMSKS